MDALGPAPPGGDQNRGYIFLVLSAALLAFAILSGAFRLITRKFIVRKLGWDDITITIALVREMVTSPFNMTNSNTIGSCCLSFPQFSILNKFMPEAGGISIIFLSQKHSWLKNGSILPN